MNGEYLPIVICLRSRMYMYNHANFLSPCASTYGIELEQTQAGPECYKTASAVTVVPYLSCLDNPTRYAILHFRQFTLHYLSHTSPCALRSVHTLYLSQQKILITHFTAHHTTVALHVGMHIAHRSYTPHHIHNHNHTLHHWPCQVRLRLRPQ